MLTDEPERRFEIDEVYAAKRPRTPDQRLTLESGRWHQGRLLARFVRFLIATRLRRPEA